MVRLKDGEFTRNPPHFAGHYFINFHVNQPTRDNYWRVYLRPGKMWLGKNRYFERIPMPVGRRSGAGRAPVGCRSGAGRVPVERRSGAGRAPVGRRSGAGRAPLGTYAVNFGYPQYKTDKRDVNLFSIQN